MAALFYALLKSWWDLGEISKVYMYFARIAQPHLLSTIAISIRPDLVSEIECEAEEIFQSG